MNALDRLQDYIDAYEGMGKRYAAIDSMGDSGPDLTIEDLKAAMELSRKRGTAEHMAEQYAVEWYGDVYGPFRSIEDAKAFRPPKAPGRFNTGQGRISILRPPATHEESTSR